jgi:hypothetical protein
LLSQGILALFHNKRCKEDAFNQVQRLCVSWKKPETLDMCTVLIMISVYGYLCLVDKVAEEVKNKKKTGQ